MTCSCIERVQLSDVRSVISKTWFGDGAKLGDESLFRCSLCAGRMHMTGSKKIVLPFFRSGAKGKTGHELTGESYTEDVFLCLTCASFFCLEHVKNHYENEKKSFIDRTSNSVQNHSVFFGVPSGDYVQSKHFTEGKIKSVFPTFGEQNIEDLRDKKPLDLGGGRNIVLLSSNDVRKDWVFNIWCTCIGKTTEFRLSSITESNKVSDHVKELGILIAKFCYFYKNGIRLDLSIDESGQSQLSKESDDGSSPTRSGGDSQSGHSKVTDGEMQTTSNSFAGVSSFVGQHIKVDTKSLGYARIAGIKNPLNTCYFNAVLQCVLKCQFFTRYLLSINEKELPGPLSHSLFNIIRYMNEGSEVDTHLRDAYPYANAVLRCLCEISPIFSRDEQQDCQELFLCLANGVADEFDKGKSEEQKKKAPRISFEGVMRTEVTCKGCQKQIPREEMFMALSVPVDDSIELGLHELFRPMELKGKDQYACEECFKRLSKEEQERHNAVVRAENDKKGKKSKKKSPSDEKRSLDCVYSDAVVQTCIGRLGGTLVLHLLRFQFDGRDFKKITRNVSFPISLDLSHFVSKDVLCEYERRRAVSSLQARFPNMRYDVIVHALDSTMNNFHEAQRWLSEASDKKGYINIDEYDGSRMSQSQSTTESNSMENNTYATTNGSGAYNVSSTGSNTINSNHVDVMNSPEKKREHHPSLERDLIGIVTHRGSLHGGHYVAYVRDLCNSKVWFRCDDEEVERVEVDQVLKCQSEVYMLFYE
ncbi:Peptidase C19 [Trypanosoma melophagium]|uniref:Peptidase C19 n=1 Tax=Trypanosoma melophagium TaxID=715481 RepID=UPI00351A9513|nr:Peptidase C19 [Trypanosoma melophagium]